MLLLWPARTRSDASLSLNAFRDWPQSQHDAAQSGIAPLERLSFPLEHEFTLDAGGLIGTSAYMAGGVAVCGDQAWFGTLSGSLVSVTVSTGAEGFRISMGDAPVRSTPAVAGGLAVAGFGDALVSTVDVLTGNFVWFLSFDSAILASPVAGRVGSEDVIWAASAGGILWCLTLGDGAIRWSRSFGGGIVAAPVYVEDRGRVYVASYDQRVHCLDAATGADVWRSPLLGPLRAPPQVFGDRIYVSTLSGGLVALWDEGGASPGVAWSYPDAGPLAVSPVVLAPDSPGDRVRIHVANMSGTVFLLEDHGAFCVTVAIRPLGSPVTAPIGHAAGETFVVARDGTLTAVRDGTGSVDFSSDLGAPSGSSAIISRGRVFALDDGGRMHAIGNRVAMPLGLSAVAYSYGHVGLVWTPQTFPHPVSGYLVFRSTMPDRHYAFAGYVPGTTPAGGTASVYVEASLTEGGAYYYAVVAQDEVAGGPPMEESTYSDVASAFVVAPSASLAASLAFDPSPVSIGGWFTVALTVTNTGSGSASFVEPVLGLGLREILVEYLSGPVPPVATLAPGEHRAFAWTYSASGTGTAHFTATVTGVDALTGNTLTAAAAGTQTVTTPPVLVSALSMTPGLVETGMRIVVALTVTNTGGGSATGIAGTIDVNTGGARVSLVSGPVGLLALAPGGSGVLAWTYSVVGSGTVKFTATAAGQGGGLPVSTAATRSYTIRSPARLTASLDLAPSPAVVGQWVTVTLTVHNPGGISATAVQPSLGLTGAKTIVERISGPIPDFSVTLDGGSRVFVWTYSVDGVGTAGFSVTVTGLDTLTGTAIADTAFRSLVTKVPTTLASVLSMTPGLVEPGMRIVVGLTVTNTGGMDAENVVGTLDVNSGSTRVRLISGPTGPLTLGPGESGVFAWTFSTTGSGSVKFTATAAGQGDGTGYPVSTSDTHAYTIKTAASLNAVLAFSPSPATVGQWVTVTLTVHNPGGIGATAVVASLSPVTGTALVEAIDGPTPAYPVTLAGGGGVQVFTWTWSVSGAGKVKFSATAWGEDILTGAPILDTAVKTLTTNEGNTNFASRGRAPGGPILPPGPAVDGDLMARGRPLPSTEGGDR